MPTPLVEISVPSIYKSKSGHGVPLPRRMAQCPPDMEAAIRSVEALLLEAGGRLALSDLFRSYDMQLQSHLDWVNKKKKAYSPPPGGSLHEAGRALDLDLASLNMSLAEFWDIARASGWTPIIDTPKSTLSEAWHFDCRGSHDLVYRHYAAGRGDNFEKPYQAMAASAIVAVGVRVDRFGDNQTAAAIQGALIRLGQDIGNIDGDIGARTRQGLDALGVPLAPDLEHVLANLEAKLRVTFPPEYHGTVADGFAAAPAHVIA